MAFAGELGDDGEGCAGGVEGSAAIWILGGGGLGFRTGGDDKDGVVVGQVADTGAEGAVEGRSLASFKVESGYKRGWVLCLDMVALQEDVAVVG